MAEDGRVEEGVETQVIINPPVREIGDRLVGEDRIISEADGKGSLGWNDTHIVIHPSVKEIDIRAFECCMQLRDVKLNEGLELINARAFNRCIYLEKISIPSTVSKIGEFAFAGCSQLMLVELQPGLESIESEAFAGCTSLVNVHIPPTVTVIDCGAFKGCTNLVNLELCKGLMWIRPNAFGGCTSLVTVGIPSTVRSLSNIAFKGCTSLVAVNFCEEVEELVSLAKLKDWWNHGVSKVVLMAYKYLMREDIPKRTQAVQVMKWRTDIYAMVQRIPSTRRMDLQVDCIDSHLSSCERLTDAVAPLLKLALLKSKTIQIGNECACDNVNINDIELKSHHDLIPNVLSFLDPTEKIIKLDLVEFRDEPQQVTIDPSFRVIRGRLVERGWKTRFEWNVSEYDRLGELLSGCTNLLNLELCDRLTVIFDQAFKDCTSLVTVTIPSRVYCISGHAFEGCTSLVAVIFCEEIEELVSSAMLQDWWNHGVSKFALMAYEYLRQLRIPRRTSKIRMLMWRNNIYAMLQKIPSVGNGIFEFIDTELSTYQHLQDVVAPLLMLALWKSKMTEIGNECACDNVNTDEIKLQSRHDSESMAIVIIPNVLSFLQLELDVQKKELCSEDT